MAEINIATSGDLYNNTKEYNSIKEYFIALLNDVKQDIEKNYDKVLLLLITRKGYWLFKNLSRDPELQELLSDASLQRCIRSDRYVLKDFEYASIEDKIVYIFDDTICRGRNLFFYYCALKKHGARKINVRSYAMNTDFYVVNSLENCIHNELWKKEFDRVFKKANELKSRKEFEKFAKEFYINLQYAKLYTPYGISELLRNELFWFQSDAEPMVMDLPVFRYIDEKNSREIFLSEEEFSKLCTNSIHWEYVHTSYNGFNEPVYCDFFQYKDEFLYRRFENLFFDFVVKCKYQKIDSLIKVVFIPFPIIKSGSYLDVFHCFEKLLLGTPYYNEVMDYFNKKGKVLPLSDIDILQVMKESHNLCRGIFRAVIFSFSNYIGKMFQEKVTKDIGCKLFYDKAYMYENSDENFVETFLTEYKCLDIDSYILKIADCTFTPRKTIILTKQLKEKQRATEENVELYIRDCILKSKYATNKTDSNNKRLVTIEKIQSDLDLKFIFENFEQKKLYVTKTLLLLLDLSCAGNEITADDTAEIIYRGFRAGEGSDVAVMYDMRWVYYYIYAYYNYWGYDFYKDHYEQFVQWMREHFRIEGYMNTIIDIHAFIAYMKYFSFEETNSRLYTRITNKRYLLDNYFANRELNEVRNYIDNAFLHVKKWGDQISVEGIS